MQFLSVRPDFCRRLPSDSTSQWTPLPLAICFPSLGRIRDFHPLEHAHAGRTTQKPALNCFWTGFNVKEAVARLTTSAAGRGENSQTKLFNEPVEFLDNIQ